MPFRFLRNGLVIVALALSLAGCIEEFERPTNHQPTAYDDSQCRHGGQSNGNIVGFECAPKH